MKWLQTTSLYRRMREVCKWQKNGQFDKSYINRFVRDVTAQRGGMNEDSDTVRRENGRDESDITTTTPPPHNNRDDGGPSRNIRRNFNKIGKSIDGSEDAPKPSNDHANNS